MKDEKIKDKKQTFIEKIKPLSEKIETEYKIKPIITITQAAHESNWGQSKLTKEANNLFGMIASPFWIKKEKPVYEIETKEFENNRWITKKRPFRKYESWLESLKDWASLITGAKRYQIAKYYAIKGDIEEYAKAVSKAGYATDPKYAEKLINISKEVKI